ncbi:alpha/beta hydrolase [soil metagenome]
MAIRAFGSVFAEVEGVPRILALHGWGRRSTDFRAALAGLGYLAPDLPGFGASPSPSSAVGASGYAAILEPLLDAIDGQPILVGHSFGGRIATVLAADHPERFAGLVLTGAPLIKRASAKPPWIYRVGRAASRLSLLPDSMMARLRRRYGSTDYRASSGVMRDVLVKAVNESYEDLLPRLTLPVILLWGSDDGEVPVAVAQEAADLIPGARLIVVPGAGHLLPVSHPDQLRPAVESLFR